MKEKIISERSAQAYQSYNKIFASKSANIIITVALILIGNFLVYRNTGLANPLVDFTYQLENSYRITVGQVPYKDFFLVLTPGIYYIDALFLEIFGQSNLGQIVLTLLMHSFIILFTNRILVKITGNHIVTYLGTAIMAFSESVTYPYVSYNSLCFLLMLGFGLYLTKHINNLSASRSFIIGFLVALPFYAKQNYGVFFAIAFYFFFLCFCLKTKKLAHFLTSIGGSLLTVAIFLVYLGINQIDLYDFLYQTLIFPSAAKHPLNVVLGSLMGAFSSNACITYIYVFLLILFFERSSLSTRTKLVLSALLSALIWIMLTQLADIEYNAATNFWFLGYALLVFIWLIEGAFKKRILSNLSIGIISFFIMLFGILTKRPDAPLWMFCIIAALIYKYYSKKKSVVIIPLLLSFLLVSTFYQANTIKMGWVNEEGTLQVENNIDSRFYKMGMNGPWLEEMEDLSLYIRNNVGEASFVEVPCEDPIYWATDTTPQLNFFQMYSETNPYPEKEFAEIISDAGIQVIIVKRTCQFKYYMITEDEIDAFERQTEEFGYKLVDRCGIYDILMKQ